jgi:hypothetical protein
VVLCVFVVFQNKATLPYWNNGTGTSGWQKGWHGYDNTFNDMKAFFLATGPGNKLSSSSNVSFSGDFI